MTIDFIQVEIYTQMYYYMLWVIVLFSFLELRKGYKPIKMGVILLFFVVLYIGLRPVSGKYFGDMGIYAKFFKEYQAGRIVTTTKDAFFHHFMKYLSFYIESSTFFLICSILYVVPLYLVSKKWFKEYWFYGFLMFIASFSFWGYGTNGIRNGIAGSLFLLGISRDKRIWQIVWIVIAIQFHKSMILPTLGFLLAQIYNNPKIIILFWLLCIPLSLVGGSFWESFFANLGFQDERVSYLIDIDANKDEFSSTGFRWDFLLYSSTAVFSGWYFIVKKNYQDKFYYALFNTYVFANAFWILVIRANFSNRFAYLSWFMIAAVIVYPFLKNYFISNQHKVLSVILIIYFSFTFLLNVILSK